MKVEVKTTYLEINHPSGIKNRERIPPTAQIIQSHIPLPSFYRFLYSSVGKNNNWTIRLSWSDEQLLSHLSRKSLSLYVLYIEGTPAGYIELDKEGKSKINNELHAELGTEIAYFGIFPEFQGKGLGKSLLSFGIEKAFEEGAERVWLHTCTLDSPHALYNYLRRGFVEFRVTFHDQEVLSLSGVHLINASS